VIFVARLALGSTPGETLHVIGGLALSALYALYQIQHWNRVAPFRARMDYTLGLIAAVSLTLVNATGLVLGMAWWQARASGSPAIYPPLLSAAHNIFSMLVLAFVGGHLAAVLMRDRRRALEGARRPFD